jgi:pimeloyl-ACP methyl ester carboxylesterase
VQKQACSVQVFLLENKTIALIGAAAVVLLSGLWLYTPDKSRAALEQEYLRAPSDMMEVAGTRLHVRVDGPEDAPAVIMIHGFGSSLHTWEPWAQALSDGFRVVRFDLPGAGLSPPDPTGEYTDQRTVEILLALMNKLDLDEAAIIGNSIGGRIAWRFAAAYPEEVSRLVLIAPDGFASPGFDYGQQPQVGFVAEAMKYVLPRFLVRMNLKQTYGDPSALTADTVDRYYDLLLAPGVRDALLKRMEQTVLEDPTEALSSIEVPVLLVWGEKDQLIPFSNAEDYLNTLPDARLISFPELGHVPMEEAPEKTLEPVRDFLSEMQR